MSSGRDPGIDLSRIAHDLRGPLMPLRTAAWLLRNELSESPRACELADIVERQSARLASMMDELSDWGRSAGAQLALDRKPVELSFALDMAIGAIPGCAVEPRFLGNAGILRLQADPYRLGQLLSTLIEHAIHRGDGQAPEIEVSEEHGQVCVRVHDAGAPPDDAARSALLDQPQTRPFDEGLGLRLLMARRIAEAHGGRLDAEVTPQGSFVMTCRLPICDV